MIKLSGEGWVVEAPTGTDRCGYGPDNLFS